MSSLYGATNRPILPQQVRTGEYARRPVEPRRATQANPAAPVDGPAPSRPATTARPADRTFAEILARVSGRPEMVSSRGLALPQAVGQRSRLLEIKALRSTSTVPAQRGDQDAIALERIPFTDLLVPTARKYGVSPELVAAVVKAESAFNPLAQSRAGAKGLMQLMDGTARSLGVSNVFDPAQNLEGGIRFLRSLLMRFNGNTNLALAAYNAGPGAVEKYGGIPPYTETRDYVSRVIDYWRLFGGGIHPLISSE